MEESKQFKTSMKWEIIEESILPHVASYIRRTEIPSGWLVESVFDRIYRSTAQDENDGIGVGSGLTYIPDANKEWQPTVIRTVGPTIN